MTLLAFEIEYDGSDFAGWQLQNNGRTVQGELERAVSSLCAGEFVRIQGAGRTDAGVHARGQVAHCVAPEAFSVPADKLAVALNSVLPPDVRIRKAAFAAKSFHARFDASAREYSYKMSRSVSVFERKYLSLIKFPIDGDKLNGAGSLFLGRHDFTAFSKYNPEQTNRTSEIKFIEWAVPKPGLFHLTIKADRFLYGQVRLLVGAMLDVARGKRSLQDIEESLATGKNRKASPAAPPEGLTLEKVYYPIEIDPFVD